MSSAHSPNQDAIRRQIEARSFEDAARAAVALGETSPLAPHPLQDLLAWAASRNCREDLLETAQRAEALAPNDPRLLELRADILLQIGRLEEAENAIREALRRRPAHNASRNLLAAILAQACRFSEAFEILRALDEEFPNNPATRSNLAYMKMAAGDVQEALTLYRQAIVTHPDNPRIRLNYSIALLKAGQFQQGWAEHEWRFGLPGHTSLPQDRLLPNLTANLDLNGKHILVTQEEGLGDTLMYLRYIPCLAARGAIVRVWGADIMASLTARVEGVSTVQVGGNTPYYDYHCPFISLPRAFAATATPMGAPVPYLSADPTLSAQWAARLRDDHALRIGIVWAGAPRPENTDAYMIDQRRSMPLACLAALTKIENIRLYSLQLGEAAQQLNEAPYDIVNVMNDIHDMGDTAALIDNLDVVVSVDTSVAHLAGGMGKPVLLMDRINPCWRWMQARHDSPWYPNLRIIRQTRAWEWSDVVKNVARELQRRVEERR
ncbi:tetratricopeptide repeat protein [Kozakia baliensis]|uniref:Uncharacterized protein n=1 Tax=Kozakia baliensis TaxID=153496 RepID=A0A1D8USN2_9PROT|nr:tetratricopeptide repeat protein [Kozakia baliensis]AOX16507.1 hypothetical protein A0U89_04525 [Kozakia baliensis]GBR29291.1 O-linked N-acetylglucosamine transferase [Kozakia baliensis NRIC 0488]GEL63392.1 hypothetical protein KBA01_06780 [Kozakia baliensis]